MDAAHALRGEYPLNVDPAAQLRLLDLQSLDAELDRLAHRRRTLPVLDELDRLAHDELRLRDATVTTGTQVSDLEREQERADADVTQVRERRTRDQRRLEAGAVSSPRELESLQHEIASLERRQSVLEDAELEVMEALEEAQQHLAHLAQEHAAVSADLARVRAEADRERAAIDEDADKVRTHREQVAAGLPGDLLALYDKVRAASGGVGAAALRRRRCEGCHLDIDPSVLADFRAAPPDAVLRCEECRRILVRVDDATP